MRDYRSSCQLTIAALVFSEVSVDWRARLDMVIMSETDPTMSRGLVLVIRLPALCNNALVPRDRPQHAARAQIERDVNDDCDGAGDGQTVVQRTLEIKISRRD